MCDLQTMPASRDLPIPLVTVCLLLTHSSLAAASTVVGSLQPRGSPTGSPVLTSEDYSQYEDPTDDVLPNTVSPDNATRKRCDYNPCLESQTPCPELAATTRCLCPGFTLHTEAPEAPKLKSVSWNGSEVVVWWCAPYSFVTAYIATVGGQERQRFGKDQRRGGVGGVDHISEVCVAAMNDVGESSSSCMMYHPADRSLALRAGLIGGALGLLLLLLLAVLLWRRKRQRKQQTSYSMHDTAEIQ